MKEYVELNLEELQYIDGGWDWELVLGGATLVVACIGVAASAPASLPILAGGALCTCSGLGGAALGIGIVS